MHCGTCGIKYGSLSLRSCTVFSPVLTAIMHLLYCGSVSAYILLLIIAYSTDAQKERRDERI